MEVSSVAGPDKSVSTMDTALQIVVWLLDLRSFLVTDAFLYWAPWCEDVLGLGTCRTLYDSDALQLLSGLIKAAPTVQAQRWKGRNEGKV